MTYFFVFLLQALLPTALLLGCSWFAYTDLKIKPLVWLTLCGLICGILSANISPTGQVAALTVVIIILIVLILFYFCQFFYSFQLNRFWHFMLVTVATFRWAKDPNIAAITNTDVINTDFILHFSAIVLGCIFCVFIAVWLYILLQQYKTMREPTALCRSLLTLLTLLMLIPLIGDLQLLLMKLQILELTKMRLSFVAKATNVTTYFNYINAAVITLIIGMFVLRVQRPHTRQMHQEIRPIEKRKKTALYRDARRTVVWGVAAVITVLCTQLYWDNVASRPPRLSEAVPVRANEQDEIHIPIEQIKDGKLHRFVWIADDGKAVRFFIINRQPERLSFGVVFDACLLCGDQGYVMQDDQVICVGCGVRMFIPSIGKPGGCNPVPIEDWRQTESEIIVYKRNLEEGLNLFSTIVEIEVIDPVDGTRLTNLKTEYKYVYEGKTYFFVNENNLERFRDNPEHYYLQGGK